MEHFKDYIYVKKYAINPDAITYIAFDNDTKSVTFYFGENHKLLITEDKEFYNTMKNLVENKKLSS